LTYNKSVQGNQKEKYYSIRNKTISEKSISMNQDFSGEPIGVKYSKDMIKKDIDKIKSNM
jgi:hypothetical protein